MGTCLDAASLAAPLRAPGRLDCTIELPPPGSRERSSILAASLDAAGAAYQQSDLQVPYGMCKGKGTALSMWLLVPGLCGH